VGFGFDVDDFDSSIEDEHDLGEDEYMFEHGDDEHGDDDGDFDSEFDGDEIE